MLQLSYLKRFFAGSVFGAYIAYLLYFLNPQVEITPARIIIAIVIYAAICGVLFGSALWMIRLVRVRLFGRGESAALRHGFGSSVTAVALSALIYWGHLALLRIYLPRGAIRLLSKATVLIAATAFLLFLLWLVERNASRRVSRVILLSAAALVALSCFLLYQRREGYRSDSREVVHAEVTRAAAEERVVVVAIRNLPYDWLLTAQGEESLPNIRLMQNAGYSTRIEPFRTSSQKAIWASLATGQLPSRHGVTGRFSYRTLLTRGEERFTLIPSGIGFRAWGLIPPVERVSAHLPAGDSIAFWNCFRNVGVDAAVVNWPGSDGSGDGDSIALVSERELRRGLERRRPYAAALAEARRSTVLPPSILGRIAAFPEPIRNEITRAMMNDVVAARLSATIRRDRNPKLSVVAFNGIAEVTERLRTSNMLPARGERAGDAVRAHLALLDLLIGEIRQVDPGASVVIVSPSAPLPPSLPVSLAGIARIIGDLGDPGRNDGFVIFYGPRFVHRANPAAGEVIDFVPSLLYASGLPLARDLDGTILTEGFDEAHLLDTPLSMIATYRSAKLVVR